MPLNFNPDEMKGGPLKPGHCYDAEVVKAEERISKKGKPYF